MAIAFLVTNMKKNGFAKYYAVVTQGFFTIIVLLLVGYILGRYINKDSVWPAILATIGALCGVAFFIKLILSLDGDKKDE